MIPRFRAWHFKEKRMYEVGGLQLTTDVRREILAKSGETDSNWIKLEQYSKKDGGCVDAKSTPIKNIILMQSMGRRDENNQEIFAGDFVRITSAGYDKSLVYIVVKDDLGFFLQGTNHTTKKFGDVRIKPNMRFVVVGNIHKNTKLLEDYWRQVKKDDTKSR